MAREQYELQLKQLHEELMCLANRVEDTMQQTIQALFAQNKELARRITMSDDEVDTQVRKMEAMCYDIILRQQPVASDLRVVSATIKVLTDMERIGDHGVDISELTLLMAEQPYPPVIEKVKEMSAETLAMFYQAVGAFASISEEEAHKVIERDDVVDRLFMDIKTEIAGSICDCKEEVETELDLLMVAKYFERVSDHATNIAEWALFAKTGVFPNN